MLGFKATRASNVKTNAGFTNPDFVNTEAPTETTTDISTDVIKRKEKKKMTNPIKAMRHNKYGVGNKEKYDQPLPTGVISRAIAAEIDSEAQAVSRDYCYRLANSEFKSNKYFTKKDNPYKMISEFYDGEKIGTQDYECNIIDITRYTNISRRAILSKSFMDEKLKSRGIRDSYFNGKYVHGTNMIKFMAWAVTHAWVTGLFLDRKGIFDVIPKSHSSKTLIPLWNSYISMQDDIREEVKVLFKFDEKGNCPFVDKYKKSFCSVTNNSAPTDDIPFDSDDKADVSAVDLTTGEEVKMAEAANKEMDAAFEAAVENDPEPKVDPKGQCNHYNLNGTSALIRDQDGSGGCTCAICGTHFNIRKYTAEEVKMAEAANKEMDAAFKAAVENDPEPKVDPKAEVKMQPNVKKEDIKIEVPVVEVLPAETSPDTDNKEEMTFGELIADKVQKGEKIREAVYRNIIGYFNITKENFDDYIKANNEDWGRFSNYATFTKYVNEAGKKVFYIHDLELANITKAFILNDNGDIVRDLRIDNRVIYGDSFRIITMDNASYDIRKETFIPISNKEIVMAAINGPLTKEQRKTIMQALPRCLSDFRGKYTYLDKVDMSGIGEISGEGKLTFNDWRTLVINISNILKAPNFPLCRVRISEFKDVDNFQLVCDDKVFCCWNNPIYNEPSNMIALQNRMFVIATSDSTKKGVNGYYYTGPDYDAPVKEKKAKQDKK